MLPCCTLYESLHLDVRIYAIRAAMPRHLCGCEACGALESTACDRLTGVFDSLLLLLLPDLDHHQRLHVPVQRDDGIPAEEVAGQVLGPVDLGLPEEPCTPHGSHGKENKCAHAGHSVTRCLVSGEGQEVELGATTL